jgi:hypothetical protein
MDGLPFIFPGSLPDFLHQQAALHRQRRARGQAARRKPPRPATPAEGGRVPLADGLSFRLLSPSLTPGGGGSTEQAEAAVETFRLAFLSVWARVPEPDRRLLQTYWRDQPDRAAWADRYSPRYATVRIRVVDGVDWSPSYSACERLGNELVFPTSLVTEHPDRLPCVIARTLALAVRYANGAHWGLYLRVVEDPMEAWEARHGAGATDAERDAQLGRLEKACLLEYEKDVRRILRGWGYRRSEIRAGQ